jgi:hypothetical protein
VLVRIGVARQFAASAFDVIGQLTFGRVAVITQDNLLPAPIPAFEFSSPRFRFLPNTLCAGCPLQDLLAIGIDVANHRLPKQVSHLENLSQNAARQPARF